METLMEIISRLCGSERHLCGFHAFAVHRQAGLELCKDVRGYGETRGVLVAGCHALLALL